MKNSISLFLIVCTGLAFSCNGTASTNAGKADSTIATDSGSSTAAAQPPAPADQSSSSAAAPASSSSSSSDASSSSASSVVPPVSSDGVASEPTQQVTEQQFNTELAPSGTWVDYPGQGQVWQPSGVPSDFEPYSTNGHWVYSNDGWTWASNYKWGWATFHYGGWIHDNSRGWLWKPGTEWAPARVTWSQSGGYYGWAPLPPNVSINARWTPPANSWTFVPKEHIVEPQINRYAVNKTQNVTIVKNVTVINNITNNKIVINNNNKTVINNNKTVVNNNKYINTTFNKGPQITEVEKVTNKKIVQINTVNKINVVNKVTVNNNRAVVEEKKVEVKKVVVASHPAPREEKREQKPEPKRPNH